VSNQTTQTKKDDAENSAQPFNALKPLSSFEPKGSLHSVESNTVLKACVKPSVAIAQYQEAMRWSPFATVYSHWMSILDTVGIQQLAGTPVVAADALIGQSKDSAAIERTLLVLEAQKNGMFNPMSSWQGVDATVALQVANALSPRDVSLRRRAANQGELTGVPQDYVPPSGAERLQHLMDDWQQFVGRGAGDMNPLLLVALAHCQLMCVRPFTFSNTATAQVLNQFLLFDEGMLDQDTVLPLAWQFSHRSNDYWQTQVQAITEQNWEPWVLFFMQKAADCAERCLFQLQQLEQLRSHLFNQMTNLLPANSESQVLAVLCCKPSCGIADVVEAGVAKRQTAASYLSQLAEAGVLRECRVGKEKRFVNDAVLALLLGNI